MKNIFLTCLMLFSGFNLFAQPSEDDNNSQERQCPRQWVVGTNNGQKIDHCISDCPEEESTPTITISYAHFVLQSCGSNPANVNFVISVTNSRGNEISISDHDEGFGSTVTSATFVPNITGHYIPTQSISWLKALLNNHTFPLTVCFDDLNSSDQPDFCFDITDCHENIDCDESEMKMVKKDSNETFKLFPNPSSDFIHLQSDIEPIRPTAYQVIDVNGRNWISFIDFNPESMLIIPIKELHSGVYYLLVNNEATHQVYSFVKH